MGSIMYKAASRYFFARDGSILKYYQNVNSPLSCPVYEYQKHHS